MRIIITKGPSSDHSNFPKTMVVALKGAHKKFLIKSKCKKAYYIQKTEWVLCLVVFQLWYLGTAIWK